jgi:hypothetical protein
LQLFGDFIKLNTKGTQMSKYFTATELDKMDQYRAEIYAIREKMFAEFGVDPLDTDALSSLAIRNIVKQYDDDFNVNFARNGEDACSNGVLIEQKACRVNPSAFTSTGRIRSGYEQDAVFQFHAMGDLDHARYILVARSETDLSILRIYDISDVANRQIVLDHLNAEKAAWLAKGQKRQEDMKRDVITISEKFLLAKIKFASKNTISGCKVFKD